MDSRYISVLSIFEAFVYLIWSRDAEYISKIAPWKSECVCNWISMIPSDYQWRRSARASAVSSISQSHKPYPQFRMTFLKGRHGVTPLAFFSPWSTPNPPRLHPIVHAAKPQSFPWFDSSHGGGSSEVVSSIIGPRRKINEGLLPNSETLQCGEGTFDIIKLCCVVLVRDLLPT